MLPRAAQHAADILTRLLVGFMLLILIRDGAVIAGVRMNINYVQLGWPSGLAYFALPITASIMLLFLLISLWDMARGMR
ncbi:MAG TPA: TRAP transporter small permease subunit [Bacteroidota bacterium]